MPMGAVLTALHVVDGAAQIQVEFADGTTADRAASRPASRSNDIAVLAVDRLPEVVVPAVLAGPPADRGRRCSRSATRSACSAA